MIEFRGPAKRLDDTDLPRIGQIINVGEDEIHAVLDVESGGSGFDAQGRPKMLFEPHIFYRNTSGENRTRAVREGLAYTPWRPGAYPKDSYPRLVAAMAIDQTAALKSASYGLGQILGENFKAAGYPTVQAMVLAFVESEANQLEGMIRFIQSNGLDDNLRHHDWAGFARGYNGPGYKQNGYDTKLAAAYARWQRIKDTPWDPTETEPPGKPDPGYVPPAVIKPAPAPSPAPPAATEKGFVDKFLDLFRPKV